MKIVDYEMDDVNSIAKNITCIEWGDKLKSKSKSKSKSNLGRLLGSLIQKSAEEKNDQNKDRKYRMIIIVINIKRK